VEVGRFRGGCNTPCTSVGLTCAFDDFNNNEFVVKLDSMAAFTKLLSRRSVWENDPGAITEYLEVGGRTSPYWMGNKAYWQPRNEAVCSAAFVPSVPGAHTRMCPCTCAVGTYATDLQPYPCTS
jgi:hypothetical protein